MSIAERFLIALTIIFAAPYLLWRLARTDYWAPLVVVQIIAGILLGPGVLGAVFPSYYATVFTPQVIGTLNGIAWWAVMLFVFVAGLELDLGQAWTKRRETGVTAGLALIVPLAAGSAAAAVLLRWPGWAGAGGAGWQVLLGIGMACAVTALPILILLMEKLEVLRRPLGQRMLRYSSVDDIAIWGVLAFIMLDWERIGRQAIFLVAFAIAAVSMRMLMRRLPVQDRWFVGLIWLAACGFGADWSGLHYMVGAFLAGAVLDARWFGEERLDVFRANILMAIMPVYFLSTGLRTSWEGGGAAVFAAAALLLAASVGGKLVGVDIAGRILGWPRHERRLIGWLLQTKALIGIIFTTILLDKRIISSATFTALLLMAIVSTMLTIPIVKPMLRRHPQAIDRAG